MNFKKGDQVQLYFKMSGYFNDIHPCTVESYNEDTDTYILKVPVSIKNKQVVSTTIIVSADYLEAWTQ